MATSEDDAAHSDEGAATILVGGSASAPSGRSEPAAPRRLGRYVVLERIGIGGMGVVYSAHDPDLDRRVAIKLLRHEGTPEFVERLQREARALARLNHPNVLTVYEQGIFEGRPYVVTELVEGETLRAWLGASPRHWRRVLALLLAAGRGLAAAHAMGIVHRDFKPDNVLVDREGRPRVADFGVARSFGAGFSIERAAHGDDPRDVDDDELTQAGTILGTVPYMAPEHARGQASERSDQFSFCVTAFEALCGARPFVGSDRAAIREAIEKGRITRPPGASAVPRWLMRILERGLATDPRERFASMTALLSALEAGLRRRRTRVLLAVTLGAVGSAAALAYGLGRGESLGSCAGGSAEIEPLWGEPRRAQVGDRVAATPGHGAASWRHATEVIDAWTGQWLDTHRRACEATARGEQSGEALDLTMGCLQRRRGELAAVIDMLADGDDTVLDRVPELVGSLGAVQACEDTQRLRARAALPTGAGERARIDALDRAVSVARATAVAGRYREATDALGPLVAEAQDLGWAPLVARTHLVHGQALGQLGETDRASEALRAAAASAEEGHDDALAAEAWIELVSLEGYVRAEAAVGRIAATIARAKLERIAAGPLQRSALEQAEAAALLGGGRVDEALAAQERAMELLTEAPDASALDRAHVLMRYGAMLQNVARHDEAIDAIGEALEMAEAVLGQSHPSLAPILGTLTASHYALGDLSAARGTAERTVALLDGAVVPDAPVLAKAIGNLGLVYLQMNEPERALAMHERALSLRETSLGKEHPELALAHDNIGSTLTALGRVDEAIEHHLRALTVRAATMGEDHPWNGYSHTDLGRAYLTKGEPERARDHLERALTVRLSASGPDPVEVGETKLLLARALATIGGENDRARELAQDARDAFEKAGESTKDADEVLKALRPAAGR
jgi:eukaryotic-like serine/threonine-protein kinase